MDEGINPQFMQQQTQLICWSYEHWTGRRLLGHFSETGMGLAETIVALFEAPFAVLSHDTQADPVFNYANRAAMHLFGMNWQEITRLPSRHSAEPFVQEERAGFLDRVAQHGFVDDYSGVRIATDGSKFVIENATVWNLVDVHGRLYGQAAMIPHWHALP